MVRPQAQRRVTPNRDFRPVFSVSRLAREIGCESSFVGRVEVPTVGIDYYDAHVYAEKKARQQEASVILTGMLRRAAHAFIENYRLVSEDSSTLEYLGAGDAFDAAAIVTRAEFAISAPTEAYGDALTEGIRLGDHAVYINLPKSY
jgi:hypothetical protein